MTVQSQEETTHTHVVSSFQSLKRQTRKRPLRHLVAAVFCVLVVIWIMYVFPVRTLESLNVGTA